MSKKTYTPEQAAAGERVYNALRNVREDKRQLVAVMVETFINGMAAQEWLAAAERPGA